MNDSVPAMTSHRPYLMRALYEWIVDNGMTPHILVDAGRQGVRVPPSAVKDGRVVLNIAERAVARLSMDNDEVQFTARFGGVSQQVRVPVSAVIAIYARETGQGMALPEDITGRGETDDGDTGQSPAEVHDEDAPQDAESRDDGPDDDAPPPRRGHLRIVK